VENNTSEYQNEIILSRILKLLGIDGVNMDDFNNRLKYQKLIYLAQNMGVNLGYGYSWYVRGPYAPPLTRALFNLKEKPEIFEKWDTIKFKQEDEVVKRLGSLKNVLGTNFDNPNYLEVLASLHYLRKTLPPEESACPQIEKRLLNIKPDLKQISNIHNTIQMACKDLEKFN
jgi:uncharacterized protein YwgA